MNLIRILRELIKMAILLVFALGAYYLLVITAKRPDGCEDKTISKIGACDASGYCAVAYEDGTRGFQQLPIPGFGYTVCPEKRK